MTNKMLRKERYKELVEWCEGRGLNAFWCYLENDYSDFLKRRDALLSVIYCLLKSGRIKLANNQIMLNKKQDEQWDKEMYLEKGTIEEQLEIFRKSWPENEKASGYEDFDWWFFDKSCPYCILWNPIKQ